ncbi:hypothetical protein BDM02DRAFT_2635895 [Thelephora ganbajun]|uniref:Uncharacterized protein n=1 Tax=Thelephora ganbajun TaxID=370292 RepID=A0ACB6ZE33_THEGA|nr:hypothetical protein BDM02DRAFT_2635895 [Thelephora ganbajun]
MPHYCCSVIFYLFVVVAGTVSMSCPYQTPESRVPRSAASAALATVSVRRHAVGHSHQSLRSRTRIESLKGVLCEVPRMLVIDTLRLVLAMVWVFVAFARGVYMWFFGTSSIPE